MFCVGFVFTEQPDGAQPRRREGLMAVARHGPAVGGIRPRGRVHATECDPQVQIVEL